MVGQRVVDRVDLRDRPAAPRSCRRRVGDAERAGRRSRRARRRARRAPRPRSAAACCIGGMTFSRAILAAPSTPNLSLRMRRLPAAGGDRQSRRRRQARPRSHGEELCRETQHLAVRRPTMTQDHGGDRGGHRRTPRPLRSAASADASPPGGGRPALPRGHGRRCRPERHPGRGDTRRRQVALPVIAAARLLAVPGVEPSSGSAGSCRATAPPPGRGGVRRPGLARGPRPRRQRTGGRERPRPVPRACGLRHHLPGGRRRARAAPRRVPAAPLPAVRRRAAPPARPCPTSTTRRPRPRTRPGRARSCRCSRPPGCGC